MAGDEVASRVRFARGGNPGPKVRGVVSVMRSAGEGPGPSRRRDDRIDQEARNGHTLRRLRERGAIGDALRGEDHAPCRLCHQHVLEAGPQDAAVPGRVSLLDMENRYVGNQSRYDVDIRIEIRI